MDSDKKIQKRNPVWLILGITYLAAAIIWFAGSLSKISAGLFLIAGILFFINYFNVPKTNDVTEKPETQQNAEDRSD